jgi:signal transduction histidine kinase
MKKLTFSLKSILIFSSILLGGMPILVMGFIAIRLISADIDREVRAKNLLIAQSLSSEVQLFLGESLSLLQQIEETVMEKRYIKTNEINGYLGSILESHRQFDSIEILDEEGTIRFRAPSDPEVIGINLSGQVFFSHVRQYKQPYWSPTFISLQTGKPTLTLAIPVRGGMIVGYLNLASLNAMTDRIRAGRLGYALMVDQQGTVIAHPDRNKVQERQNLKHLKDMGQEKHPLGGNFQYQEDDRDYLASVSQVPQTLWTAIVTVPADEAFAPVARVRALFGAGAVMTVILAMTIVFLTLRKALDPLSQLVRDARRIADGHYVLEKRASSYKEIDDLVNDFQRMAGVIQSREEALQESERRLSEAQKMAQLGHWIWDVRTGNVEWSEEVFKIFHLDPKDFTPHIDSILALSPWPEDHERDRELIRKAMETNEKGAYEQRFLRPDRSIGYYHSTFQGKYDDRGNLISIVGTVQDITERKRADEEIKRLNADLEGRVRERTAQLEASNKELESFAYSVSHDLRAPLRAMDGFSAALFSGYPDKLDEQGRHYLNRIQAASQRMGQLINDLLNLSRVTRGEFITRQVDLSALAREVAAELQARDPKRKAEFAIDPQIVVHGDVHLLRIVLENLLSNAWKFTAPRPQARIEVGMAEQAGERIYFVRDNGVGFDMTYADKLFTPFQRLHGMREFPGTGIGLATVQRIITRHGGRVWPEAAVDQGATFFFTLP